MRIILSVLFSFLLCISAFCQSSAFPGLSKLVVDDKPWGKMSISYNPKITKGINKKYKDLDKTDSFFPLVNPESEGNNKAIMTRIDTTSKTEYIVVYSVGPSADPGYLFFDPLQKGRPKVLFRIDGLNLYIPGDGFIYVDGHTDNNFNQRRKFKVADGILTEVKQPFYYIGLKTKSLKPLVIYSSTDMKDVVDNIPANTEIEVIYHTFYDPMSQYFLLRTKFGLTGWYKMPEISQKAEYIEGIFFNGD